MNAMQLLAGPVAQAIGWALLHLLWQGTIVAGILAAALALLSRRSANARYVASCAALAVVFLMFIGTAVRAYDPGAAPIAATPSAAQPQMISLTRVPVVMVANAAATWRERLDAVVSSARNSLPLIVALWLAGVVVLSSRLLLSWMNTRRLATHGAREANAHWQGIAARLSAALGLRHAVRLLESAAVEVPSVLGTMRPIILLPAAALTGLTPEQMEMVLAHELAHIRRHDFLVNLMQAFVETLMFYHPAIWWMSRRVRIERENCCDDLAVAVCGNALQYARALARLEELRANAPEIVVAANGGSLLDRVRRLVTGRAESIGVSSRWAAAVAMLSVLAIALAVPSLPVLAKKAESSKKAASEITVNAAVERVEPRAVPEPEPAEEPEYAGSADIDIDIDPRVDIDIEAPEAPEAPEVAVPAVLAMHDAMRAPRAPRAAPAPMPAFAPGVAVAPPAPPAPGTPAVYAIADMARDYEYDYDDDGDDEHKSDRVLDGSGKLTVDELISLRAVGVTPDYIKTMRAVFPDLTVRTVASLRAVGVTPEYIQQMRSAGFEIKSAREATSLRAVGVTPEYVQQMRNAGFTITSAKEATSLRAVDVTPEYVQQMRAAGFTITSAKDATSMRAVGVTPEFVQQMRNAGFAITSAKDATSLAAVGVTPQWLRDMKAAGVDIDTAKEATSLRAVGVTPEFVNRLAKAGYSNLSVRELTRLAAAGVDDDFIHEMEQYRKK